MEDIMSEQRGRGWVAPLQLQCPLQAQGTAGRTMCVWQGCTCVRNLHLYISAEANKAGRYKAGRYQTLRERSVSPCCGVRGPWRGRGAPALRTWAVKRARNEQGLSGCPPALSLPHTGSIPWLPKTFLVLPGLRSGAAFSAVGPPAFRSC